MHLRAAVICMDHDIGLQNTFWTGPGIGNWGRPADCATFMTSQADPEAFCQGKIGSSQTFSERYGKWTGFNEHQNVASEPGGKSFEREVRVSSSRPDLRQREANLIHVSFCSCG